MEVNTFFFGATEMHYVKTATSLTQVDIRNEDTNKLIPIASNAHDPQSQNG